MAVQAVFPSLSNCRLWDPMVASDGRLYSPALGLLATFLEDAQLCRIPITGPLDIGSAGGAPLFKLKAPVMTRPVESLRKRTRASEDCVPGSCPLRRKTTPSLDGDLAEEPQATPCKPVPVAGMAGACQRRDRVTGSDTGAGVVYQGAMAGGACGSAPVLRLVENAAVGQVSAVSQVSSPSGLFHTAPAPAQPASGGGVEMRASRAQLGGEVGLAGMSSGLGGEYEGADRSMAWRYATCSGKVEGGAGVAGRGGAVGVEGGMADRGVAGRSILQEQLLQVPQVRSLLEQQQGAQQQMSVMKALENFVAVRLRVAGTEVQRACQRAVEMEERGKQLASELALTYARLRNSEAISRSLRSNLEQAVALSREEQTGDSDGWDTDAASSVAGDDLESSHARALKENEELREQRQCRVCRSDDVSMLLLPCRHLCLCRKCEGQLDACPLCKQTKQASVLVYMS